MRISKNSWHYKLCDFAFHKVSTSLCVYFWQVPIAILSTVAIFSLVASMVALFVFILAQPLLLNINQLPFAATVFLGISSLGVWCATLKSFHETFNGCEWDRVLIKKNSKEDKPKKESLIKAYLKAKKDKICPKIEFYRS